MFRLVSAVAVAALFATPAFATVTTIEFKPNDGSEAVTIAFDDTSGTSTIVGSGESGAYTYDEATGTVCGTDAEGQEICATFENPSAEPKAGDTANYTTSTGAAGVATVISVE